MSFQKKFYVKSDPIIPPEVKCETIEMTETFLTITENEKPNNKEFYAHSIRKRGSNQVFMYYESLRFMQNGQIIEKKK
jgi:hypothetical protein